MWMMKRKSAEELDSILYFLSSALTSVIDDSSYLAHHGAAMPNIGAGLATAEIASRLAMFREQVCDVSQREFMVVTKLARARHWAQELRRHEPHLRADIDAFLSATARCEAMARNRAPDAQSVFDGQAQPKRFLADRVPGGRAAAEAAVSLVERLEAAERGEQPEPDGPRYLIGGEMSVEALNEACERLLARLSAHYGWEDDNAELEDDTEADAPELTNEADAPDAGTATPDEVTDTEAAADDEVKEVAEEADARAAVPEKATGDPASDDASPATASMGEGAETAEQEAKEEDKPDADTAPSDESKAQPVAASG